MHYSAESSNGRTRHSECRYWGSNPCSAASDYLQLDTIFLLPYNPLISCSMIERRVDFLGIPVKRTNCDVGYGEELSHPPLLLRSPGTEKKYVYIKITPSNSIEITSGIYADEFVQEASPEAWDMSLTKIPFLGSKDLESHIETDVPIIKDKVIYEGSDVKKYSKGPRRWNGIRVSFRLTP